VKVTTDLRPTTEVEFELVRDVSMAWVRLPRLSDLGDDELRRAHLHALREAFLAEGPERTAIDRRAIGPLEADLRRRGLEIEFPSMEHAQCRDPAADARVQSVPLEDDVPMCSPRPSDLKSLDEKGLRRLHARVMRAVFNANGPRRMGLGVGVLKPIEAEMRRRGLEAGYWSMAHKRRSDAAVRAEMD
jgi:hypothetical protein